MEVIISLILVMIIIVSFASGWIVGRNEERDRIMNILLHDRRNAQEKRRFKNIIK